MMDEIVVEKNLKDIFIREIITAAIGVTILVLITRTSINTGDFDAGFYVGFSLCLTFGVAIPVVVTVLSGIAKTNLKANPKLVYVFSIITLIGSIGGSGACAIGAIAIGNSIGTDIHWYQVKLGDPYEIPPAEVYLQNLGLHIAVAVLFSVLVVLLILVIVSAAKNLKESSDVAGFATTTTASRASTQPAAAGGGAGGGTFCQQCGHANVPGAKFCKSCGKAL
ncbi:MAG: zinc ribbon domain-containing protein [Candidatus Lokiarchaeota archaeon]|nr:zinc ribbon domain-containing protein [Candidatus Lokiarchaeota archaeon]